ncbi:MAG TPA: long-chain fatty acid--CoA ligase [Gaiellaceae bacterium]|nr:long-chain fatty acid--CoA ligase [Gaiellaceae bacterium]
MAQVEARPQTAFAATAAPTIGELWRRGVEAGFERPAFLVREEAGWRPVGWDEAATRVSALANGFLAAGLRKGDKVALLCRTRIEWTLADFALATIGAVVIPVYPTSSPDEIEYILRDSDAKVLISEDEEQLAKTRDLEGALPALERVLGVDVAASGGTLADIEAAGPGYALEHPLAVTQSASDVGPEDVLTFLYTSGTTGPPKGCVLTQRNYAAMVESILGVDGLFRDDDTVLLFLPLAHNFARLIQFLCPALGFTLAFCPDVRGVSAALAEVKPTLFPSVPRVYEKVYATVMATANESSPLKRRIAEWSFAVGEKRVRGGRGPLLAAQSALADRLVLGKVRARLGGRMRYAVSGGAPLAPEIAEFFEACGLTILEGYGMTECTTAATLNRPGRNRIRTVGQALPGIELKIDADGEILIRGATVFGGYYRNPEATAETLTEDGWLRSGDIGTIDGDGYLTITDRKKDIIITAGGKNVAPQGIENSLKASAYVSQALVVGDNRPYLVALLTVDRDEVAALGEPGSEAVREAVQKTVDEVNETLGRVEQIKRFAILERDFSPEEGEVTPTLKLKRRICIEHFAGVVEDLYAEGGRD